MNNVDLFLKQIKSENTSVKVFVPSLRKYVEFTPITVQQQKNIIKDTLSGVSGNIQLQRTLNNIIVDNNTGDDVITIIDRCAILTQLRIAYLGREVNVGNKKGTLQLITPEALKDKVYPIEKTITDVLIVTLQAPTLIRDSGYVSFLTTNKEFINPGDLVNDLYVAEVAKFITTITLGDNTVEPGIADSLRIVNELPTTLITKIMKFIKVIKDIDNTWLITTTGDQVQLGTQFFNDPV